MARMQLDNVEKSELAAEGGKCDALYNLGLMYSTGRGVDVDLVTAHKWFNLAAMKGSDAARSCRAELAAEMSPAEIATRVARAGNSWHCDKVSPSEIDVYAVDPTGDAIQIDGYFTRRGSAKKSRKPITCSWSCMMSPTRSW